MKGSNFKSLVILAASVFIIAAGTNTATAQRRGGSSNRSSGFSRGFQESSRGYQGYSRGGSVYAGLHNRISPFRSDFGNYGRGYSRVYFPGRSGFSYRPHIGLSLRILPFGYYPFFFGNTQFYYSGGLYYRQYNDTYRVVVPPVGAEVPSIPSDAQEVTINGQTYYEYKGVYYNAVVNNDGKTVYVVAGKDGVLNTPNGSTDNSQAITVGDEVDVLPQNVKEVMLKGEKYYVSEDGVYYEEITNGDKVTYRVVGL